MVDIPIQPRGVVNIPIQPRGAVNIEIEPRGAVNRSAAANHRTTAKRPQGSTQ